MIIKVTVDRSVRVVVLLEFHQLNNWTNGDDRGYSGKEMNGPFMKKRDTNKKKKKKSFSTLQNSKQQTTSIIRG
jgi:hypothetical protein